MKILFIASANKDDLGPIIKAQGESLSKHLLTLKYYRIKGKGILGYFLNISKLRNYIKQLNPDIIHAHYSLSGIIAGLSFSFKPLVVSLMGSDTKTRILMRWAIRFFSKMFWDKVIVKSKIMQIDCGIKNSIIIPNGVHIEKFRPSSKRISKKTFQFSENKHTVLFFANPSRESKNFKLAQQAFKRIDSSLIELKILYDMPHEAVSRILNAADVILLTSKWEGSPNIIKEAMACNCPIVSTNVGDVEWLFGNEPGHFLTSFDPKNVADKIQAAIEFTKTNGRTNGRKRIVELGLDSKTVAKKIITVYKEVLEKNA